MQVALVSKNRAVADLVAQIATIVAAGFSGAALIVNMIDRRARSRPVLHIEEGPTHQHSEQRSSTRHICNVGSGAAPKVKVSFRETRAKFALQDEITDEYHPMYSELPTLILKPFISEVVATAVAPTGSLLPVDFAGQVWDNVVRRLREQDAESALLGHAPHREALLEDPNHDLIDKWFYFVMVSRVEVTYADASNRNHVTKRGRIKVEGTVRRRRCVSPPMVYTLEPETDEFKGRLIVVENLA